jgi:molybdopterin synthase sulfur carrier subunit
MRVHFYATLRAVVGQKTIEMELPRGARAIDLARAIANRWPELASRVIDDAGEISRQVHMMVDGRNVRWLPDGSQTPLRADATIDVFPPSAGG